MTKKATLLDQQEKVVRELQDRLLKQPTNQTPDALRNLAVALGVAVDKFIALKPRPKGAGQFWNWSGPNTEQTSRPLPQRPENTC